MLCNSIKKFLYENKWNIVLFVSLFFFTTFFFTADAYAVFDNGYDAAVSIFKGLRKVIYPAATIGVACVCIGGMFGSFNWKWLVAILLGVFIIAFAEGVGGIATDGDISLDGNK